MVPRTASSPAEDPTTTINRRRSCLSAGYPWSSGSRQGWKKPGFKKNQPSGFFGFFVFFFKKNQPSGFFGFFGFFLGFLGFLGFFGVFGFFYICPEEGVFRVFQLKL